MVNIVAYDCLEKCHPIRIVNLDRDNFVWVKGGLGYGVLEDSSKEEIIAYNCC